jgi:hypothetical protein
VGRKQLKKLIVSLDGLSVVAAIMLAKQIEASVSLFSIGPVMASQALCSGIPIFQLFQEINRGILYDGRLPLFPGTSKAAIPICQEGKVWGYSIALSVGDAANKEMKEFRRRTRPLSYDPQSGHFGTRVLGALPPLYTAGNAEPLFVDATNCCLNGIIVNQQVVTHYKELMKKVGVLSKPLIADATEMKQNGKEATETINAAFEAGAEYVMVDHRLVADQYAASSLAT